MSRSDYHNTGKVRIGVAHGNPPEACPRRDFSHYELYVQRALLDAATARPEPFLRRMAKAIWRWL